MYDLVLFVLGVALAEVATTTQIEGLVRHTVIITLILTIVAVAGARRASQRRRDRELRRATEGIHKRLQGLQRSGQGRAAVVRPRSGGLLQPLLHGRAVTGELDPFNRRTVPAEPRTVRRCHLGRDIPRFTMGESRLVCHRTTPFRQIDQKSSILTYS